ncbi:MAG: FtsW/RodA/SpoVE family cell cycle protein [Clostridiales bacterium]|nr:FtsW/RodA/SpoVE family cell cycle protein [Clostridiales bacterium]
MSIRRQWQSFDFLMLIMVIGFACFGVVIIGSASAHAVEYGLSGDSNQKMFVATGVAILVVATLVDYHFIAKFYIPIYVSMIIILLFMFTLPTDETHTNRWLRLTIGGRELGIQPSEFVKLMLMIALSKFLDMNKEKINTLPVIAAAGALIAAPAILVALQPALSASVVIVIIGAILIFAAQIKFRYVFILLLACAICGGVFYWDWNYNAGKIADLLLGEYQVARIYAFLHHNPQATTREFYQINISLKSIRAGELNGKGLGNGSFIPAGTNDFIFSVLGEEFGFMGCAAAIAVAFIIITKCLLVANRAPDLLGNLIATGVAGMLAFEVFVNVSVATSILPNTGMSFPFLSSGGSAMWVNMACIGLVLNIGLYKTKSIFEG